MLDHATRETRRSLQLVVLATVVAVPLRIWPLGRLGLNQFDEGIYAMVAGWALQPAGLRSLNPALIPYAPPGYPILIGLCSWVIGYSDQTGLLISAVLGSLTIPIVAWVANQLADQRAAAIAAWCACFSGPHIAFSRMGLTDASFLFTWSIGTGVAIRFLVAPTLRSGLILGLCVGLSQEFKYNGWLLGSWVIISAFSTVILPFEGSSRRDWLRFGGWGGIAIFVSSLVVLPWYVFVENHGGYGALLAHQRSYLSSYGAWWPHLRNQVDQAVALGGPIWLGLATSISVGLSVGVLEAERSLRARIRRGLIVSGLIWPLLASPLVVGILVIPSRLMSRRPPDRLVTISWLGLFGLTPFYHPYARLWLPLEMLHWILLGAVVAQGLVSDRSVGHGNAGSRRVGSKLVLMGILVGGFLISGPGFPFSTGGSLSRPALFAPSDSLRLTAGLIVQQFPANGGVLRTLVRPSMAYYLGTQIPIGPQADLNQLDRLARAGDWALIDSTVVSRSGLGSERTSIASLRLRWDVIAEIPAINSLPTALDIDPGFQGQWGDQSWSTFWLLHRRTSGFDL